MIYVLCAALLFVICFCFFFAWKYRNPYKLIMVFGKKGSGKTTFLTKLAYQYQKKGRPVYSTEWAPGVRMFDVNQIGFMSFPENSVIFIDEVGMIWDNRNFKAFKTEVRDYFKLQRHYKHTVYLFSQTFDIDIKLRNLTDAMYLLRCHMGFLSIARKIKRDIVLVQPTGESEARIADSLEFEPFLLSLFGARTVIFTFIPRWTKLFNSHEAPELAENVSELVPVPDKVAYMYKFLDRNKKKRRRKKKMMKQKVSPHGCHDCDSCCRLPGTDEDGEIYCTVQDSFVSLAKDTSSCKEWKRARSRVSSVRKRAQRRKADVV